MEDAPLTIVAAGPKSFPDTGKPVVSRVERWAKDAYVEFVNCNDPSHASTSACSPGWRGLFTPGVTSTGKPDIMIGAVRYAHTWSLPGRMAEVSDYLAGLDWQIEGRSEYARFGRDGPLESGWSIRGTPILAPLSRRKSERLTVVPYARLISFGVSRFGTPKGNRLNLTDGAGGGIEFLTPSISFLFEISRYTNTHGFESYHVYSGGFVFKPRSR